MKHAEEHRLLDEVLTGPELTEFRESSLREALAVLHRRQRRRRLVREGSLALLPLLVVSLIVFSRPANPSSRVATAVEPTVIASVPELARPTSVEYISDEELLALFPNQPLALVGPEGQQQLVFLDQTLSN